MLLCKWRRAGSDQHGASVRWTAINLTRSLNATLCDLAVSTTPTNLAHMQGPAIAMCLRFSHPNATQMQPKCPKRLHECQIYCKFLWTGVSYKRVTGLWCSKPELVVAREIGQPLSGNAYLKTFVLHGVKRLPQAAIDQRSVLPRSVLCSTFRRRSLGNHMNQPAVSAA